jgi:hypothetical protein
MLTLTLMCLLVLAQPSLDAEHPRNAEHPSAVRLIDVTGDGALDQVLLGPGDAVRIAVAIGGRSFQEVLQPLSVVNVQDVLASDLNGDGWIDLYLVSAADSVVLLGDGTGVFRDETDALGLGESSFGLSAEHLDVDADGLKDLLLHNASGDLLFWAQGDGTYQPAWNAATATSHGFVARLELMFVNNDQAEVDGADILDGSLTGADISTSSGDVSHGAKLTTGGEIHAQSVGVRFPDGTLQATAQLVGPVGADGATGAIGPPGAEGATGAAGPMGADGPHTGGINNLVNSPAFVGGGQNNSASGLHSIVGAGFDNTASGDESTVGGGRSNFAGNLNATIAGGLTNVTGGSFAAIGGGRDNGANGNNSVISGGTGNATVGVRSTVGGGGGNSAVGHGSTVGGGFGNNAGGNHSTVGGGQNNSAAGDDSVIAGGNGNTAFGDNSLVAGGEDNVARGDYSFAAGRRAKANHPGAFVWGDSQNSDKLSIEPDSFTVYARGGSRFFTDTAGTSGVGLASGSGTWSTLSDRASKENVTPVDVSAVLERLCSIPITTWNYTAQADDVRHMGPMAQDFRAAFGLGVSDQMIDTVDPDGVALAAIQGLAELVRERDQELSGIRSELAAVRRELVELTLRAKWSL